MMQQPVVLRFCLSLAFLLAAVSTPLFPFAALADDTVTLAAAIRMTLERRPETGITVWDAAVAAAALERSEAALDPRVTLRAGVYDDRMPVLSGFQPAETLFAGLDAAISKPLDNGGTLTLTADYSRTRLRYDSAFAAQLSLLNPAWRGGVKIDYRHPLLRGAGRVERRPHVPLPVRSCRRRGCASGSSPVSWRCRPWTLSSGCLRTRFACVSPPTP